ncbi:MAG: glycosyltransferase [Thermodesulfobacteriota bacterium]
MKFNVLHTEWSDGWGGQEMRILLDAQVLTGLGHRVTILTVPDGGIAQKARAAGVPVLECPMRHAFSLPALYRLTRLFLREGYDVINTHSSVDSWLASMAARLARRPVLVRTRHLSVPLHHHALNFVYRMPDGFVATAELIRRDLIERLGLDPRRVVSIPTGVDLARFDPGLDPGPVRRELGLAAEHRVVTMLAVLRSWKRHEVFLEAAARLAPRRPDLRFLIVGEGPRRGAITSRIEELGLQDRVFLTGHRADVPEVLAATQVCVLTSESSEGVPQSVLQAQAMAKPVAATAAGGIPEVVEHEKTGLLCPVNEAGAVAAAIARLLDDSGLAGALGRNARRQVERRFSQEAMAGATVEFYGRLHELKGAKPIRKPEGTWA